jgi:predicted PurR-regulated permease PerM
MADSRTPWLALEAACLVVVIAGLRTASEFFVTLLFAALLAVLTFPLVSSMRRRGVPTLIAVLAALVLDLALLAALGILVARAVSELSVLPDRYAASVEHLVGIVGPWLHKHLGVDTDHAQISDVISGSKMVEVVSGAVGGIASVLTTSVLVLMTMTFMLLEATGFRAKLQAAFGNTGQDFTRLIHMATDVQRYIRIKTGISLAAGVILGAWTAILGLDFPLLWGIMVLILNFIPTIGSLIATVLPVLLAVVQFGPGRAGLVLLGFVTVNTLLGNVLEPALLGRGLGLSTLVVLVSLIFWGWVWGPAGTLLAVPLTMVVKIALENTHEYRSIAAMLDPPPRARAS